MEVSGKIIVLNDTQTFDSGFQKRTVVIETEEQYKQSIPIDFVKDRIDLLDKFKVGDSVTVGINIRGNEYNGKYFCSLNGWKIQFIQSSTGGQQEHAQNVAAEKEKSKDKSFADSIDDDPENSLPF